MKSVAIAILVYFAVAVLLDLSYAIQTKGLPWYHWLRMVRSVMCLTALCLFAAYVWPFVTK